MADTPRLVATVLYIVERDLVVEQISAIKGVHNRKGFGREPPEHIVGIRNRSLMHTARKFGRCQISERIVGVENLSLSLSMSGFAWESDSDSHARVPDPISGENATESRHLCSYS